MTVDLVPTKPSAPLDSPPAPLGLLQQPLATLSMPTTPNDLLQFLGSSATLDDLLQPTALQRSLQPSFSLQFFLSRRFMDSMQSNSGGGNQLTMSFAELIREIWSGQFSTVRPNRIKRSLDEVAKQFAGWTQQDSHEFLAFLLDTVHEDVNRVSNKPHIKVRLAKACAAARADAPAVSGMRHRTRGPIPKRRLDRESLCNAELYATPHAVPRCSPPPVLAANFCRIEQLSCWGVWLGKDPAMAKPPSGCH